MVVFDSVVQRCLLGWTSVRGWRWMGAVIPCTIIWTPAPSDSVSSLLLSSPSPFKCRQRVAILIAVTNDLGWSDLKCVTINDRKSVYNHPLNYLHYFYLVGTFCFGGSILLPQQSQTGQCAHQLMIPYNGHLLTHRTGHEHPEPKSVYPKVHTSILFLMFP